MSARRMTIEACRRRKKRVYRLSNIVNAVGSVHRKTIRTVINRMTSEGLMETVREYYRDGLKERELRNLDIRGIEAMLAPRRRSNTAWDRLWKAARILRDFTKSDLAEVAGATAANTQSFLYAYKLTGHFRSSRDSERQVSWKLINDSGPKRPDANTSAGGIDGLEEAFNGSR